MQKPVDQIGESQSQQRNPLRADRKPYRILLADDHAVVRRGLRSLLESQPDMEVCGEAATGPEALEQVRGITPDLLVLDLEMPGMGGLDVTRAVRAQYPCTSVLILTMHFSEELAREVLHAGALAYVLKSDADAELLAAIDHVRHNQPFFTNALAVSMAHSFAHGLEDDFQARRTSAHALPECSLTSREIQIMRLLAGGRSNKEAALELGVSSRTVESHRMHIMHKMNFRNFSDFVRFAIQNNLVKL